MSYNWFLQIFGWVLYKKVFGPPHSYRAIYNLEYSKNQKVDLWREFAFFIGHTVLRSYLTDFTLKKH